ncbi:hypothetical protein CLU79DRAFT_735559 [Phycomyces nitens]|nr:hypothetical protein CLU79DRAFT_735559 [Phycomyces nitens]
MLPFIQLPATCELCGNWIPQHLSDCPRNGVHPSQWLYTDHKSQSSTVQISFMSRDTLQPKKRPNLEPLDDLLSIL